MMVTNRAGSGGTGDAKYDAYAQTILEVHGAAPSRVDLRRPIGPLERAALASVGLDRPFAVLTAENPHGRNEEDAATSAEVDRRDAENDDRLASLVARLGDEHVPFVRVDGVAPDGGYRERCVAVLLPRPEAASLALRLGQLALFWFDGESFWLIPAEADAPPRRLPEP